MDGNPSAAFCFSTGHILHRWLHIEVVFVLARSRSVFDRISIEHSVRTYTLAIRNRCDNNL